MSLICKSKAAVALFVLASFTAPDGAVATPVSVGGGVGTVNAGGSWFVDFERDVPGASLAARATWTFVGQSMAGADYVWSFIVGIKNNSTPASDDDVDPNGVNRITGFGWDTNPDAFGPTPISLPDGWFFSSGQTPGGLSDFDICLKDGGPTNTCTAGSGAAAGTSVNPGDNVTFEFSFKSAEPTNLPPSLQFDRFYMRFMTVTPNGGSETFLGTPSPIPLPAPMLLLLGALGGLGAIRYARRDRAA